MRSICPFHVLRPAPSRFAILRPLIGGCQGIIVAVALVSGLLRTAVLGCAVVEPLLFAL